MANVIPGAPSSQLSSQENGELLQPSYGGEEEGEEKPRKYRLRGKKSPVSEKDDVTKKVMNYLSLPMPAASPAAPEDEAK